MRHAVVLLVYASLVLPSSTAAQTSPTFSGRWTMDPARSASAVQNHPVTSKSMIVEQTPTEVTIVRTNEDRTFTTRYRAGAPGKFLAGGDPDINGIWYMDGPRLVTETAGTVSDKTVSTKEIFSLDQTSGELWVETLAVVEHGYTLRGAKNYATGKDVYTKAAP